MKFGKLVAGAILAVSAVAANAADFSKTTYVDLSEGSNIYGQARASKQVNYTNKTFLDTFNFSIGAAADLDGSLTSTATLPKFDLDIDSFQLFLGGDLVASGVEVADGVLESWTLNASNLAAGDYSLVVGGKYLLSGGGSYSGVVNVTPVPEPTTWAMLGLGLAAVGVAARRKQAK